MLDPTRFPTQTCPNDYYGTSAIYGAVLYSRQGGQAMHDKGSWRLVGMTVVMAWAWWLLVAPRAQTQSRARLLTQAEQAYNQKQYAAGSDLYLRLIGKEERSVMW
jgi:hypothetical protein